MKEVSPFEHYGDSLITIALTLDEIYEGTTKTLHLPRLVDQGGQAVPVLEQHDIAVPKGVRNGTIFKFEKGASFISGQPPAPVFLRIVQLKHKYFTRDRNHVDLHMTIPISKSEARSRNF